ncbi:hypothetical protein EDD21DRAFT_377009 [Dissophora ornata]|nr:hypothetical protein EDD21DRAFT_377009 [Dissophora ornata]
MFARQVDPLAEFSSAISAAELHHRAQQEALDQTPHDCSLFDTLPSAQHTQGVVTSTSGNAASNNPHKRKHPLHFEPDFYAALDSSLKEEHGEDVDNSIDAAANDSSASLPSRVRSSRPARPIKRVKKSTLINTQAPLPTPRQDTTLPIVVPPIPTLPTKTHKVSSARRSTTPGLEPQSHPILSEHRSSPSPTSSSLHNTLHKNVLLKSSGFRSNSTGPSIIDLSSGEELVALHLGENEHKRRRDGDLPSPTSSTESLREVFEYQDDGTLLPILDHAQAQPSPAKKVRMGKACHHPHLRFLSEAESEAEGGHGKSTKIGHDRKISGSSSGYYRLAQNGYWSGVAARRRGSASVRSTRGPVSNRFWDDADMVESNTHKHDDHHQVNEDEIKLSDDDTSSSQSGVETPKAGQQILIRYQGSKTVSLTDGRATVCWSRWKDQELVCVFPQDGRQGKELVLYQKPVAGVKARIRRASGQRGKGGVGSQQLKDADHHDARNDCQLNAFIEELSDDDDDGNVADDEGCKASEDGPLMELEEKIMDMELD